MTNGNKFKIGLALNHIATVSDDVALKRIGPYLDEIEKVVLAEPETAETDEGAEWIKSVNDLICSKCKLHSMTLWASPYCPHCGARMNEETSKSFEK